MKKLITELTEEELLSLLDKETIANEYQKEFFEYKNDIVDFISTFNLKMGDKRVTNRAIYKLYYNWSKTKLSPLEFSLNFNNFFNRDIANYFTLNISNNEILTKTLKFLQKKDKTKSRYSKNHFEKYLSNYTLKNGSFFITDRVLYNLYDKWVYSFNKKHPLGLAQFTKFCKLYFNNPKYKYIDKTYYFGVDKSIVNHLTEDLIESMKNKNAKKTNKKI